VPAIFDTPIALFDRATLVAYKEDMAPAESRREERGTPRPTTRTARRFP